MDFGHRVLVTGATGFIGQHLSRQLVDSGAEVWAGVFPGEAPQRVRALPPEINNLALDVRNPENVADVIERCRPEIVFHLVATGVIEPTIDPLAALEVNVRGTIHLLRALQERQVKRIILVGTCHEYGALEAREGLDPFNFYAASKVAAWAYARAYWRAFNLPVVVARLFQVYGPGQPEQTLIPSAIRVALAGEDFAMTPGEQKRDFVFVTDVAEGLMAAASASAVSGQSLDLGTGQAHTVHDVVSRIWTLTGARGRILAGALPYRPAVVMHIAADADHTDRLTSWRARVGLEEGLQRTIEWRERVHG